MKANYKAPFACFAISGAAISAGFRFSPVITLEPEGLGNTSVEDLAKQIKTDFSKALDEAKTVAEKALTEAKETRTVSDSTKEKADEALLKLGSLTEQFAEIEQKMARHSNSQADHESIGSRFVKSDSYKSLAGSASQRGRAEMVFKETISSSTTDAAGSAGSLVRTTRLPGIVAPPDRRLTVRDLLTPGTMDGNTLEYVRETGFTNNAATVAELAKKPQSDLKFDLVSTSAKVIAHYMKASRQILSDAAQLQSYIDNRLRYGLAYVEEQQLLNGDGTGQNLLGIIPQASEFADPIGLEGATGIDLIRMAMLQAVLAEYPATGHVMNPIDWARIETLKDTQGRYIIGNPQGTISPTLWGLPVVQTQAIQVDKFLTGAFRLGAQVFDRWQARVEIATENEDDFTKNLVTMLAEERLALAVYRPECFIYGDFGNIA